ncbi:phosphopantetheine-binding protein [Streptomyces sp. NPDC002067]
MLTSRDDITAVVHDTLNDLLREAEFDPMSFTGTERIGDIGFTSLLLARLIIQLEAAVGADPFEERYVVSDIRTVDDLIDAYRQTLRASAAG